MRLNTDILMDELSAEHQVTYFGPPETELHLKRPEIYNVYKENVPFEKDRTYCLPRGSLPVQPIFQPGTLLICVGRELPEPYKSGEHRCIWFYEDPERIIEVFNLVQRIFDKYDDWEYTLQSILYTTASIQEMVDFCDEILQNPIIIIDASLRFQGWSRRIDTDPTLTEYRPGEDGKMQWENLNSYLHFRDSHTKSGPQYFAENGTVYYIWDIWLRGRYLGNMTIPFLFRAHRRSDRWIISVLEQYVANALSQYRNNPEQRANTLRSLFQDLLEGKTLTEESRRMLESFAGKYQCIYMKFLFHTEHSQPISFYCSYIENILPHCVCFAFSSAMVAFIDITDKNDDFTIIPSLLPISDELNLCAGISSPFEHLTHAAYYYRQAYWALKAGRSMHSTEKIHFFQSYLLRFLINSATSGMPVEALYTPGFSRIIEHDAQSKVSYTQTLHIYLNNAMNITKTALDLRIHRTSFLERLHRIEALLDTSLEDERYRLYLQILLEQKFQ